MFLCLICRAKPSIDLRKEQKYFCRLCSRLLKETPYRFTSGSSLFSYQGIIRDLILRTKVGGDHTVLRALVDLFLEQPQSWKELDSCEHIVPVPSSFVGRIRGGIDLAYFIARECAYYSGKKLRLAPFSSHWRIFKRSKQKQRPALQLNFPRRRDSIPTLLIDDVITTGFSLLKLAYKLEESQCRFLTLGNAYSIREYQLE